MMVGDWPRFFVKYWRVRAIIGTFDESRVSLSLFLSDSYVTCRSDEFSNVARNDTRGSNDKRGRTAAEVVNIELGQICFYRRASLEHDEHSGRGGQESSGKFAHCSINNQFPETKNYPSLLEPPADILPEDTPPPSGAGAAELFPPLATFSYTASLTHEPGEETK